MDLSAQWQVGTHRGEVTGWAEVTCLGRYDVTNAGVEVDGLGRLNRAKVGAPNQRSGCLLAAWGLARHGAGTPRRVALGVANLLDEKPPYVNIAGGYYPRSADPAGGGCS